MSTIIVHTETLPSRCEICHQNDLFVAEKNYCARCSNLKLTSVTTNNVDDIDNNIDVDDNIARFHFNSWLSAQVTELVLYSFTGSITLPAIVCHFNSGAIYYIHHLFILGGITGFVGRLLSEAVLNLFSHRHTDRALITRGALIGLITGMILFPTGLFFTTGRMPCSMFYQFWELLSLCYWGMIFGAGIGTVVGYLAFILKRSGRWPMVGGQLKN